MKVITYNTYGSPDVLNIEHSEIPVPKAHEVLIKTKATTVTSGDWRARSLNLPAGFGPIGRLVFGIKKPRNPILGTELSGEVIAAGPEVTKFKPGDQVFVFSGAKMGCYSEYICFPEDGTIALKPTNFSFEESAAISFGGTTALHFLRKTKIQKGDKILINGASGGVGSAMVQIAVYLGAEVTGICSTGNIELVKSLGAKKVLDYTKEDFTKKDDLYDIIIDTVGSVSYSKVKSVLIKGGILALVAGGLSDMIKAPVISLLSPVKIVMGPAAVKKEDLQYLVRLAESGNYAPVIDRTYSFGQIRDAHEYVDTGRKRGNVVITMKPPVNFDSQVYSSFF